MTPGVFMEFVFFTTKDTKRTKKPELRVLRALRGVLRTCRAFSTACAMLVHAALHKTKLPPASCVSNSRAFCRGEGGGVTLAAYPSGPHSVGWALPTILKHIDTV